MRLARLLVTLAVVAAPIGAGLRLWDHYELEPWTRDGRVRANVVQIAPDVSGLVTAVRVQDNQPVPAGTLLFEVDRARYTLALRQAESALVATHVALAQAQRESARNVDLGDLISAELREQTASRVEAAQAGVAQADVARDAARLNLERAQVRAPTDGLVTNLDMRTGSYAQAGRAALALVDAKSFYVEGYFEETKLARINVGDRVLATLRETETALDAYARELDRHAALQAARDESATVAGQARRLYQSGRTGYLDALDAERGLANSEATLAASDADLADDQIGLFLALGGGWEGAPSPR